LGDISDADVVSAYLKNVLVSNLRRSLPGLYMYLNSLTYGLYGMGVEELLWKSPERFAKIFTDYFQSEGIAYSILESILKPLANTPEGREALKKLICEGDGEEFKKAVIRALSKEARKWYRRVVGVT